MVKVKRTVSQVLECNGCPFQKLFPQNVFVEPKIGINRRLVVAEAPGSQEEIEGEPLVGGAGRVAASLYSKAGSKLEDCTKLNVLNCRPPNNVFPDTTEACSYCTKTEGAQAIQHCLEHHTLPIVRSERWELGRWDRVDLLGEKALRYIAEKEGGINRWRGSILQLPQLDYGPNAIPTLHPAYVMRDWNAAPTVISDLKKSLVIPPQTYNCYPSLQDAQSYNHKRIVVDLETNRFTGEILLVGFSHKPYHATVFPFHGPYIPEIKRIIQDADEIITQNGLQFDIPTLKKNGIFPKSTCEIQDTILAHALVSPDQEHNLGYMGSIYTNVQAWKHTVEDNKEHYCATDCDVTMQIWLQLKALLKQLELWDIYSLVSIPAAMICAEMKRIGVKLDHSKVKEVRERIIKEQQSLESNLPEKLKTHQVAASKRIPAPPGALGKSGKPVKFLLTPSSDTVVPWRSPKLVGDWLYTELGLPEQKQVKTGKRTVDKCVSPETRILKSDLSWTPAKNLKVGDELIAFDEYGKNKRPRKLRYSRVTHKSILEELCYKIKTTKGDVTVSREHGFLRWEKHNGHNGGTRFLWRQAHELRIGDELAYFRDPWEFDSSREAGYIAGFLDGEGSVSRYHMSFAQNKGPLLEHVKSLITEKGFKLSETKKTKSTQFNVTSKVKENHFVGEPYIILKALGTFRPQRLLANFKKKNLAGRSAWGKLSEKAQILAIETLGTRDVVGLQTSTATIIAEGFMTHNTALAKLIKHAGENAEAIKALMRLNGLDELLTTFAKENFKYSDTIHANFNVHGTAQGRLSSSEPNMQNYPEEARCIVIPHSPGWKFASFDFSQLENRLTAHLAGDTERLLRFNNPDFNEHRWAASVIFSIPETQIPKDNNKDAYYGRGKRINHATGYLMGPRKISNMYDIPEKEAREQQNKLKEKLSKTLQWQGHVIEEARSEGFLANAFGRKRWFSTPSFATEAASFNAQSCGADIILRCMIALMFERISWPIEKAMLVAPISKPLPKPANLLIQVHDNLLIEYPPYLEEELIETVLAVMQQPWKELANFSVPVSVDVGENWGPEDKYGSLHKYVRKS